LHFVIAKAIFMTDVRPPIQFGILGCARICRRGLIPGIHSSGVARLAAIASRDANTAAAWATEFAIPRHYSSYEALVADPAIDAVYIPLPNELHREWVLRCAAAGKHVLCEKPLALNVAEAESMVAACREAGVILMEAFMWRHHPRVAHVRRMLAEGELGELRLVKMDFSFDIDRGDWRLDPARGGGALFDLGCYAINAARLFTGDEPIEVAARAHRYQSGVDMTLAMALSFPQDRLALADCSFECPNRNRLEIVGTKAAVELPDGVLPAVESQLVIRRGREAEVLSFPACDQYAEQVKAFCAGIAAGKLPAPAEDGLNNMRAVERVLQTAMAAN
jgi:predicted dehydrogenase